jgi:hypothetical protein
MARHPNKHVQAAVKYAQGLGWTLAMSRGHAWGLLRCPLRTQGMSDIGLVYSADPRKSRQRYKTSRRALSERLNQMDTANKKETASYQFTLILAGIKDLTPDVTDALYEAGFDDALVGMASGIAYIDVNHRQAESLERAVREAICDVEKAGFHVVRVESEAANAITRINADLLTLSAHS